MDEIIGKTYVAIVLDRSGSMKTVKSETVKGYNQQVKTLIEDSKKPDRGQTFASLITFSTLVNENFFNVPIAELGEMAESDYVPVGWTAMYDGVGHAIERLCKETDCNDEFNSYLIVIISDGEENQSTKWTANQLAEKIKELQNTNRWTFVYIGSNQDLSVVRETLNFTDANMMDYESTGEGTQVAFAANATQMGKWLDGKARATQNRKAYSSKDYFKG